MIANEGHLLPHAGQHNADMRAALASVGELVDFDIETVICFHGGVCSGNIRGIFGRG